MSGSAARCVLFTFVAAFALLMCEVSGKAQEQDAVSMTLIEPTPEMPLYNLHSPRIGADRDGQATLEFSYSQTRPGRSLLADVVLRLGNSSSGQKMIFGAISNSPSTYRVRLPPEKLKHVKSEGVEIVFIGELSSSVGDFRKREYLKHHFKLSNSLLLGTARAQATTRPPDQRDSDAVAKWLEAAKKGDQFDATVPEGFTNKSSVLVPGMTICVFVDGVWKQVEFLGRDEDGLVVYRPDANKRETAVIKSNLVAQKLSELEHFTNPAMRSAPIPFKPSLRPMENSSIVIPEEFEYRPKVSSCVPGLPVKVRIKNQLVDGLVVTTKYGEPIVRYMTLDYWKKPVEKEEAVSVSKLLVAKSDLAILNSADGKARFAENLNKPLPIPEAARKFESGKKPVEVSNGNVAQPSGGNRDQGTQAARTTEMSDKPHNKTGTELRAPLAPGRKIKRYPIQQNIPKGMRLVSQEHPLQPGIQLGCNWGSKWHPVTVLKLYDDGAVRVRWDTFGPAFDADQLREDLIVSEQLLRKLVRSADDPNANPRQWTDSSGKFKMIARFSKLDQGVVVLEKPGQEEIRVSLDKLSEKDQAIISELNKAAATQD